MIFLNRVVGWNYFSHRFLFQYFLPSIFAEHFTRILQDHRVFDMSTAMSTVLPLQRNIFHVIVEINLFYAGGFGICAGGFGSRLTLLVSSTPRIASAFFPEDCVRVFPEDCVRVFFPEDGIIFQALRAHEASTAFCRALLVSSTPQIKLIRPLNSSAFIPVYVIIFLVLR